MKQKNTGPRTPKTPEPEFQWGDAPGGRPAVRWQHAARPLWAQVLPGPDVILLMELNRLSGRRISTGEELWQQPSKEMPDDLAADADGAVLAGGAVVTALEPVSGHTRWRQRPGGPVTALALDPEAVYVATRGPLFALNRADGKQRWRIPCAWEPELHPFPEANVLVVDDPETETAHALEASSGAPRWEFAAEGQPVVVGPLSEGLLYISAHAEGIAAVDVATGEPRWRFRTEGAFEAAGVLHEGRLLVSDGSLHALQPATGEVLWSRTLEDDEDRIFSVRAVGDLLFAETWKGRLLALRGDGGTLVWERRLGQVHGLVGGGSRLYVRAHQQEVEGRWAVLALDTATGDPVWELYARRLVPELTLAGDALVVELRTEVLVVDTGRTG